MFRGEILGVVYYTWNSYKKAWNEAVMHGKLFDDKRRKITKTYEGIEHGKIYFSD